MISVFLCVFCYMPYPKLDSSPHITVYSCLVLLVVFLEAT
jgi:hypothetical protein